MTAILLRAISLLGILAALTLAGVAHWVVWVGPWMGRRRRDEAMPRARSVER